MNNNLSKLRKQERTQFLNNQTITFHQLKMLNFNHSHWLSSNSSNRQQLNKVRITQQEAIWKRDQFKIPLMMESRPIISYLHRIFRISCWLKDLVETLKHLKMSIAIRLTLKILEDLVVLVVSKRVKSNSLSCLNNKSVKVSSEEQIRKRSSMKSLKRRMPRRSDLITIITTIRKV